MTPTCDCFPGSCRDGEVSNGRLPNGARCRAQDMSSAPAQPLDPQPISDDEQTALYAFAAGTPHYDVVRRLYAAACGAPASAVNGGATGWPPGMLQDDSRPLSQWLASRTTRAKLDEQYAAPAPAEDAEPVEAVPLGAIRAIAVEAIREVTGCPDIKGNAGRYLTDEIERIAGLAAKELADSPVPAPAAQPAIPAGWKLVPVEPTQEMTEAGATSIDYNGGNARWSDIREAWADMLAAAPRPQAEQPLITAARELADCVHQGRLIADSPASQGYVDSQVEKLEAALAAESARTGSDK